MDRRSIPVGVAAFTHALEACAKVGLWLWAAGLLEEMIARSVVPTLAVFERAKTLARGIVSKEKSRFVQV